MSNHLLIHVFIFSMLFLSSFAGCGEAEDEKTLIFHGEEYKFTENDRYMTVDLGTATKPNPYENSDTVKTFANQNSEQRYFIVINTETRDVVDYNTPSNINAYEFAYAYYFEYK